MGSFELDDLFNHHPALRKQQQSDKISFGNHVSHGLDNKIKVLRIERRSTPPHPPQTKRRSERLDPKKNFMRTLVACLDGRRGITVFRSQVCLPLLQKTRQLNLIFLLDRTYLVYQSDNHVDRKLSCSPQRRTSICFIHLNFYSVFGRILIVVGCLDRMVGVCLYRLVSTRFCVGNCIWVGRLV